MGDSGVTDNKCAVSRYLLSVTPSAAMSVGGLCMPSRPDCVGNARSEPAGHVASHSRRSEPMRWLALRHVGSGPTGSARQPSLLPPRRPEPRQETTQTPKCPAPPNARRRSSSVLRVGDTYAGSVAAGTTTIAWAECRQVGRRRCAILDRGRLAARRISADTGASCACAMISAASSAPRPSHPPPAPTAHPPGA